MLCLLGVLMKSSELRLGHVVELLKKHGQLRPVDVAKKLGWGGTLAGSTLRNLIKTGKVEKQKAEQGTAVYYRLCE